MIHRALVALALTLAAAHAAAANCSNPRRIAYEPETVELRGKLSVARAYHPNGTLMKYPVLHLRTPVSIRADGVNLANADEPCVVEVQLLSNDDSVRKSLYAAAGKAVTVHGTVFHSHTAWHMRPLLVIVSDTRIEP